MKNIYKMIKFTAVAAFVGTAVAGCSLDMLPLNDVVLENYWAKKADVESTVTTCYASMQENNYVSNMIVWGETRSDNVDPSGDVPTALKNLMKGSLKTTNEYCKWEAQYRTINFCNTVMRYAPEVVKVDPNYTTSDLKVTEAECKFIRALSYLTLIKTFKDVPYTTEPTIDDNVPMRLPQTKFEVILDSLIQDIEAVKNYAPVRFSERVFNSAKVTRAAMYSLLAELYLWRASDANLSRSQQNEYYSKCIQACDWVLNFKINQYVENSFNVSVNLQDLIDEEVWNRYGYPLLAENRQKTGTEAFNSIFSEGNSFESIFELTYNYGTKKRNEDVTKMYGGVTDNGSSIVYLCASDKLMATPPTKTTYLASSLFPSTTDIRSAVPFTYTEDGDFTINKYRYKKVNAPSNFGQTGTVSTYSTLRTINHTSREKECYQGWIIYRMTEIMLFRAEAEIMKAHNIELDEQDAAANNPTPAAPRKAASVAAMGSDMVTAAELYDDAYNLITAVYERSNPKCKDDSKCRPARTTFKTFADFENYVMSERRRELLFEGKRYFDLVRQSRRYGNTDRFRQALTSKFGEGGAAVGIKMLQMDFMYMPIFKNEMKVNPNLIQNSAYLDEEQILNN